MKYNKNEREQIYDDATKYWGEIAQYDQFIEEACELIVAINKIKRKKFYGEYQNRPEVEDNFVEELADTFMCLEQLIGFAGEKKVYARLNEKLYKLKGQIEKQKQRQNN